MSNLFYSLISFIIAIFFIMVGIIGIMIPWSASVRTDLIQFILEDSLAISLFGFAFIVIGLAIVVYILINAKRHYYKIKSGDNAVLVDESVIQQYINHYMKDLFPKHDIPSKLALKNNRIYLSIDLPSVPLKEQRDLLERIKQDLRKLFSNSLGYHDEFYLYASFKGE